MASPNPINDLLQKRMDRKDFLKHLAIGMAIAAGAGGLVKMFKPAQLAPAKLGYGASPYGGHRAQGG